MNDLASLLDGRRAPGVHRWHDEVALEELAAVVSVAGWSLAVVDGREAPSKATFLAAVGCALRFPETYGQNLDALADLLDDLPGPTVLLWEEWGVLARAEPRTFATLARLFSDRCADPDRPGFAVLLRGDGPEESGLPELS